MDSSEGVVSWKIRDLFSSGVPSRILYKFLVFFMHVMRNRLISFKQSEV
jgi:hypothetical protein